MKAKRRKIENKERKRLSAVDLFFLSFGGQAPFISLLTFGTVMISEVGTDGALAMLIATFVVLFNGLVIYFLSTRFKRGGGYYIYALYSLTSRLGFNTGWNYILYSLSYGGTLLSGGAFVLYVILSSIFSFEIPQWLLALIVTSIASALVISGVKSSANYAIVMSSAEVIALVFLSIIFLNDSAWNFYNPFHIKVSIPILLEAVVYGLGIPTGYSSIATLGEEAKASDIGKASITVLLFGGLLATFFFYSLGALGFTGNLVEYLLSRFGIIGALILVFIALNDGTLGGVSYILSNSRTVEAMARDKFLPTFLSKTRKDKPLYAEIFTSLIFIAVITGLTYSLGLYTVFVILGALSGLNNLFIHVSASASLVRIASKRISKNVKNLIEVIIGVISTIISLGVFFFSLPTFEKYIVYMFLGWIILGFLIAEGLEITRAGQSQEE